MYFDGNDLALRWRVWICNGYMK